jgi:hypothetical protein
VKAAGLPLKTVLLADLPPMFEDMVSSLLEGHPELHVIRGASPDGDLVAAARAANAEVVIVTRRDPHDLASVDPRLANAATVLVFALAPDGASAGLHALRATLRCLEDVSAEQILAEIGAAAPVAKA